MTSQMSLSLPLGPTCRQEVTTSTDPVTITLRTKRTCTQSLTRRSPVFCHSVLCMVAVCVTVCVLSTLCCCCARVGLRVHQWTAYFIHFYMQSCFDCHLTANVWKLLMREREREKEKVAEHKLFIVASHPHTTLLLSLYLSHYLCLSLTFFLHMHLAIIC